MSLQIRQQVALVVKAIEEKKGEDIAILGMDKNSGAFTDYFIVCSGTNPRQIQAIADDVQKQLNERPNSVEGYNQAEWVLVDYVDFVLHIFSERARKFYDLERLWKSAKKLTPADLAKAVPAKKQPATKKTTVKKTLVKKKAAAPRKTVRAKTDASAQRLYYQESDYEVVERVIDLAKKRGVSNAQIALAWMLHKPGITSPIIGATKPHHLEEAVKALEVRLTREDIGYLEEPYQPHQVLGM